MKRFFPFVLELPAETMQVELISLKQKENVASRENIRQWKTGLKVLYNRSLINIFPHLFWIMFI